MCGKELYNGFRNCGSHLHGRNSCSGDVSLPYLVKEIGTPSVNMFDIFWHKPGDTCAVEFGNFLYQVFPGEWFVVWGALTFSRSFTSLCYLFCGLVVNHDNF